MDSIPPKNVPHEANPNEAAWKRLLPIPTFILLLIGFGCSLSQERTNPANLTKFPTHTRVASPLKSQPIPPPPSITTQAAILIDAKTGKTLYEKNADKKLPVASTQKLLTALVSLSEGPLEEPVHISLNAAMMPPSKAYLRWKESYSRKALIEATLIESANDAAMALAEAKDKSQFIQKMNHTAKKLGASNSHFANPHGLDELGQYSTARDLAKIAFHAYRIPFIRHTTAQATSQISIGGEWKTLKNTNTLVHGVTFNGLKGGFTYQAGKTLIASAKSSKKEVIIVLLNSTPTQIEWEADKLWKWALKHHPDPPNAPAQK
jgi:D-alanyl-D-alanine carboxypeptidase (penicillin-binding protein 5/6)